MRKFSALIGMCVLVGSSFAAERVLATSAQQEQQKLLSLFEQTCLKTFPSFQGIESILASKGFSQGSDGNWTSKDGEFVNADLKLSGGKRGCLITRRDTESKGLAQGLANVLSHNKVQELSIKAKGIRATANFNMNGTGAEVKIDRFSRGKVKAASLIVFEQ